MVFVAALLTYILTLSPDVVGHDGGEFQFVPYVLGIAHQTGYPLFTLLGNLWSQLPLGNVAYRMNLFSALFAALAVELQYRLAYGITGRRGPSLIAALALGTAPLFWKWSVQAGVRSSTLFLTTLTFYCAWQWQRHHKASKRGERLWFTLFAFSLGLGLAHHRTAAFALLGAPIFVLLVDAEMLRRWRWLLGAGAVFPMPFLTYLYLPLRAGIGAPFDQFHPNTLKGFMELVLAGGTASALLTAPLAQFLGRALLLGQELGAQLGWLGLVSLLPGAFWLWGKNRPLTVFFCVYVLLDILFVLRWNTDPGVLNIPYLMPVLAPLSLMSAMAVTLLVEAKWRPRLRGALGLGAMAFYLAPLIWGSLSTYGQMREMAVKPLDSFRQELSWGQRARRLSMMGFPDIEPNALLVAEWEQATVFWYLQLVERVNPGVGIVYPISEITPLLNAGENRPLYSAQATPLLAGQRLTNFGALIKILPLGETFQEPSQAAVNLRYGEELLLEGVTIWQAGSRRGAEADPAAQVVSLSLYWQAMGTPQRDYSVSVRIKDENGHLVAQEDSGNPVLGLYPTSRWPAGERVSDFYELSSPRTGSGRHRLEVIVYYQENGQFHNLPVYGPQSQYRGEVGSILTWQG